MKSALDLTGQKFGMLTAIRPTEERHYKYVVWEWRCDCGSIVFRSLASVKQSVERGCTPSCGCKKRYKDVSGQKFGMLTAVRPTEERNDCGAVIWECLCDCGNTVFRSLSGIKQSVKEKGTVSCGCSSRDRLVGQRYGMLTAVRPTDKRINKNVVWEFRCDCGNTVYRMPNSLNQSLQMGCTPSCGCLLRQNLTGQRYGMLTAVRQTEERKHNCVVWEWRCDCGKSVFRTAQSVRGSLSQGATPSCGCIGKKRKKDSP